MPRTIMAGMNHFNIPMNKTNPINGYVRMGHAPDNYTPKPCHCFGYSAILRFWLAGLVLISLSSSLALAAEPVKLSEGQAIALFYQRNLNLLAARYNIDNYRAQEVIAAAIPNPTISVQVLELSRNPNQNATAQGCPTSATGGNINCGPAMYATFTQLIEMAGKRGLRMQSSAIATQAAESDFRDAVRIFSNMVRDAYYGLAQAQQVRGLMQEIVNYYKDIVASNRLRFQAGDIAESDFIRIETESLRANSDLDNAQAAVEQAQGSLATILNWPDKSMQFVAEDRQPQFKDIGQDLSREAMINKALSLRPDLEGDKQRADQAAKNLVLAHRLKYPDVTVNAGYARDPSNVVKDTGFAGVSLEVPVFYQYQGEAGQAAVNLSQMRLAAEQTELGVRNDVVSAYANWVSTNKVVKRYEAELLKHATQIRERMELAYRHGATTVLDFIDAQRTYKSVMLDYYTASINRVNAYYDLAKSLAVEPNADLTAHADDPQKIDAGRLRTINSANRPVSVE